MDSNTVEQISISHLNLAIAKCRHLNPVISSNDKTLSWDGYVELYSHGGKKKTNFIGRCPIQVKGRTFVKKDFKSKTITYSVDVCDLKNYLNDGGVVYFVVGMSGTNGEKCQIYFNSLLPFDINRIFQKLKDNQKTYGIHLKKFPYECNQIEEIFNDFLFHSKHQREKPFLGNLHLMQSTEKVNYTIWVKSLSEILDGKPTYIYEQLPYNMFIPVGKIILEEIDITNAPFDVMIDDMIYFQSAGVSFTKGQIVNGIVLNEGLMIKLNKKNDTATIQSTKQCTVSQYIKNLEFLIALSTGRTLKVGTFAFRDIKHALGSLHFHSKKDLFNLQEFFAHLIRYNLTSRIICQIRLPKPKNLKYRYEVNFKNAAQIIQDYCRLVLDYGKILEQIIRYVHPLRSKRLFLRHCRYIPPVSFNYRVA